MGTDANTPTVTIGGAAATIQKVENIAAIEPALGLDSTYPFALECITLQTPPGTPGKAGIVVTTSNGAATASAGFQYLQNVQVNAHPGLYKFLLYDQPRQFIYLSYDAGIDVFDLLAGAFKAGGLPVYCSEPQYMESGPCPDADIRGMALTPDGTQLVVADWARILFFCSIRTYRVPRHLVRMSRSMFQGSAQRASPLPTPRQRLSASLL
jgi:hypothetical protein